MRHGWENSVVAVNCFSEASKQVGIGMCLNLLVIALCRIGYMFIFESEVQQIPVFALFHLYFILVHIKNICDAVLGLELKHRLELYIKYHYTLL